jgi:predicted PurR-regulated permease PerM
MSGTPGPRGVERTVILVACTFIILAGIRMFSDFFGPLAISVFVAVLFTLVSKWLEKKGLSPAVSGTAAFVLFLLCIAGIVALVILSLLPLASHLPAYEDALARNLQGAQVAAESLGVVTDGGPDYPGLVRSYSGAVQGLVSGIINRVVLIFIVIFTTFFLLLEAGGYSRKIDRILHEANPALRDNIGEFRQALVDYLIVRTKVNLLVGVLFGAVLALLGVEGAVLWGFLMFIMGYIPYIGFFIALVPPVLLAWIDLGTGAAVLVLAVAVLVNELAEYLLFPHLAGKQLNISATVVFLSLLFWGFVLGGFGILAGVPLTMLVYLVMKSFDETRWIADLMEADTGDGHEDGTGRSS